MDIEDLFQVFDGGKNRAPVVVDVDDEDTEDVGAETPSASVEAPGEPSDGNRTQLKALDVSLKPSIIPRLDDVKIGETLEIPEEPSSGWRPISVQSGGDVIYEEWPSAPNCIHHCVRPMAHERISDDQVTKTPAKTFEYTLDHFQLKAIQALERFESVLVAAHTSAGKTTVAEYAVAMSMRDNQRVIYTSPIKALSNQKYRDLSADFRDVGLLTGDVTLNPNAQVMVMTTEILRSMLYRGSELVREVKWVIFDEVHYMRDRERGVIWEETIVLLPDKVSFVFLSATIPNAPEFAEWICRVKRTPCHTLYTDFRPTPLQHFVYPSGGGGIHLIVDEQKQFLEEEFVRAVSFLKKSRDAEAIAEPTTKKRRMATDAVKADLERLITTCSTKNYTPMIVFAFSKKEVEANAMAMKNVDLNNDTEKACVKKVFDAAMATLADEDRALPQIQCVLPLLTRGVGIHHGGLLPIVKEVIEILFQDSLIKVLFATETFAMGVNMPAKTVVFTSLRKYDGSEKRMLLSGEYIQMSGRAGRRGRDDRGIVIVMLNEEMEPDEARQLFLGDPSRLDSHFYIGYNMLLNLLRVEGATPEFLVQRSFMQFQRDRLSLKFQERRRKLQKEIEEVSDISKAVSLPDPLPAGLPTNPQELGDLVAEYYSQKHELDTCNDELRKIITDPKLCLRFVIRGRITRLKDGNVDWGWGIILSAGRRRPRTPQEEASDDRHYRSSDILFDVLVEVDPASIELSEKAAKPAARTTSGIWCVISASLEAIVAFSSVVLQLDDLDFQSQSVRNRVAKMAMRLRDKSFAGRYPLVDPITDMKLTSEEGLSLVSRIGAKEAHLSRHALHDHQMLPELYAWVERKVNLASCLRALEDRIVQHQYLVLRDDLRAMTRVLKRLGYVDARGVVTLKGRIGCEISSADELIIAELLFQNAFNDLTEDHVSALLSLLVYDEKNEEARPDDPNLRAGIDKIAEIATKIAETSQECKLNLTAKDYVEKRCNWGVAMSVMQWSRGEPFGKILRNTVFEGSMVRCIRRLEELLRQMASAAKTLGSEELENKFVNAIAKLKRGIVFSASLYL